MSADPILEQILPGFTLPVLTALSDREAIVLTHLHYHRAVDVARHLGVPPSSLYALTQKHGGTGSYVDLEPVEGRPKTLSGPMREGLTTDVRLLLSRGLTPEEVAEELGLSDSMVRRLGGEAASLDAGNRQDQRTRGAQA